MSAPKHTPEPWNVVPPPHGEQTDVCNFGVARYYTPATDPLTDPDCGMEPVAFHMSKADAARIVACVNACAGTSTDELVATGIDLGMPAMDAAKGALIILTQQRDELAAALHDMAEMGLRHDLNPCRDMASRETVDKFWRHYLAGADDLLRKRARAALAKAGAPKP